MTMVSKGTEKNQYCAKKEIVSNVRLVRMGNSMTNRDADE